MNTLFAGRMNRRTFFIHCIVLSIITLFAIASKTNNPSVYWLLTIVSDLYLLVISVKRLHDIGRKGFLAVLAFVPIVNEILALFLYFKKGDAGDNFYGAAPQR